MDSSGTNVSLPPAQAALGAQRKNVVSAGYYTAFIGLGLVNASLGPTLAGLAANTQTHLSAISILFTARALGYMGGSLLAGTIYDRRPGHPIIVTSLIVIALLMVLVPVIPLLWLLVAILLLVGLAEGTMDVGINTLIVWLHRPNVGPAMNALHFFFGLGAFIAPLVVAQMVLLTQNIAWAYWAIALILLPIALWMARLPSPSAVTNQVETATEQVDYVLAGLVVLFLFLYVGGEVSFSGWIHTYAVTQTGFSATNAALLNSGFWGAFTLGRLLSIPIAARVRPRTMLLGDLIASLLFVGAILIWPHSPLVLWIGTCGTGLALASLFPVTLTWAGRRMHISGRVTSWFFIGSSLGAMFFPWFIGQLFEAIGAQITMITIIVSLALDLVVFVILMLYAGRPKLKVA